MKTAPFLTLCALLWAGFAQADSGFPAYLNGKFCNDIKQDFINIAMRSLHDYRNQQLASQHRGGMNNIRNFLLQREAWLQECDQYLKATQRVRIFQDDKTTEVIFNAMDAVSKELDSLIRGVTYSMDAGGNPTDVAASKFDQLFKLVDDHQTLMLIRGQVVFR